LDPSDGKWIDFDQLGLLVFRFARTSSHSTLAYMKRKTLKALTSSKKDNWRTPKKALQPVRRFARMLGLGIGLDPAGHPKSIVKAHRQYLLKNGEDGLKKSWQWVKGLGIIFCNPPYGCENGNTHRPKSLPWLEKMVRQQKKAGGRLHGVFLIAARTDSVKVFQNTVYKHASAVCYVRGRLKFIGAASGALFPSAFVYFGPSPDVFKLAFEDIGHVEVLTSFDEVARQKMVKRFKEKVLQRLGEVKGKKVIKLFVETARAA